MEQNRRRRGGTAGHFGECVTGATERERATTIFQFLDGKRDVVLFCIDCSASMLELREDSRDNNAQTCHLLTALEAAMQFQKRKIIAGPNDSVGILLFNTVRSLGQGMCSSVMSFKGPPRPQSQQRQLRVEEERLFVSAHFSNERPKSSRAYAAPRRSVCMHNKIGAIVLKRICSRKGEPK